MNEIQIRWVNLSGADAALYPALLEQAEQERRVRVLNYRRESDRLRSLAAGALLQLALDEAGVPPSERRTLRDRKPALAGAWAERVQFNLSHSGSIALCATAPVAVGADVERLRSPAPQAVARRFSPSEIAWLQAQHDPDAAFFRLWVLKESYLKALGVGLALPLDAFEIRFDDPPYTLRGGIRQPWHFVETTLDGYPAAVCTAQPLPCRWQEIGLDDLIR